MKRRFLILPIIAALAMATCSVAHVLVGTLAGVVVDANGRPVPHATVTLQGSFGDQPNATHSDLHGHFAFARFRTGQYDLQAYSDGSFSPWVRRITIRSHRTTEVTLRMPPKADVVVNVPRH